GAGDAGRLDGIETQIRALAAQLEQVQEQVRSLSARTGELSVPGGQAAVEPGPPRPGRPEVGSPQPERTQFGSVTVSPGAPRDEIDRILTSPPQAGAGPPPPTAPPSPGPPHPETRPTPR